MACVVVEAIGHTAALQVIHRTVLHAHRVVCNTIDAGGLAVEDDGELLSLLMHLASPDIGMISGNCGGGIAGRYEVELAVFLQDVGLVDCCLGVVHAVHRAYEYIVVTGVDRISLAAAIAGGTIYYFFNTLLTVKRRYWIFAASLGFPQRLFALSSKACASISFS